MLKAVIFDMYETLITHFGCPPYFGPQMAEDAGIDGADFGRIWVPTGEDRTIGKMTLEEAIRLTLEENGKYSDELMARLVQKRIATKKECFNHMHKEIVPMLKGLKERGVLIGLITNCFSEEVDVIKESVLFPFMDTALFSFELGMKKPEPEIFKRCCGALGVLPSECVYVGDGGSNELEAARSLGMTVFQATWYFTQGACPPTGIKDDFPGLSHPMELLEKCENDIKGTK